MYSSRHDQERRGKGYLLDFAVQKLAGDHGDVVVILDADCQLSAGSLGRMAALAMASGRPVQAGYTMSAIGSSHPGQIVSQFAVLVKNVVRPLGLSQLGLPCLLTGSGMAFPWAVMSRVHLATGNIVEDMNLSVDLLLTEHAPIFCAEAGVSAVLPTETKAVVSQRTRWEHGHLQIILAQVPRLVWAAIQQRRLKLIAAALDIAVPPLSLLVMIWTVVWLAAFVGGWATGDWLPGSVAIGLGTMFCATTLAVNYAFCPRGSWRTFAARPLLHRDEDSYLWWFPLSTTNRLGAYCPGVYSSVSRRLALKKLILKFTESSPSYGDVHQRHHSGGRSGDPASSGHASDEQAIAADL